MSSSQPTVVHLPSLLGKAPISSWVYSLVSIDVGNSYRRGAAATKILNNEIFTEVPNKPSSFPQMAGYKSHMSVTLFRGLDLVREPFVDALGSIWASHPATTARGSLSGEFFLSVMTVSQYLDPASNALRSLRSMDFCAMHHARAMPRSRTSKLFLSISCC